MSDITSQEKQKTKIKIYERTVEAKNSPKIWSEGPLEYGKPRYLGYILALRKGRSPSPTSSPHWTPQLPAGTGSSPCYFRRSSVS
jgi:hypothetical protein